MLKLIPLSVLFISIACSPKTEAVVPGAPAEPLQKVAKNSPDDPMATTAYGKKLWSVIGATKAEAIGVLGKPNGKNKWGEGYKIPGYNYTSPGYVGPFLGLDDAKGRVRVHCQLDTPDQGTTRATFVFEKLGWNIKLWKSEKKTIDEDGVYQETLSYKGVQFFIVVMPKGNSMGDSYFSIEKRV